MKSLIGITTILTISLSAQAQNFDQLLNSVLSLSLIHISEPTRRSV